MKLKKNKLFLSLLFCLFLNIHSVHSQCTSGGEFSKTTPKRDLRGVFIASVFSLDWPTNRAATPAVQQAELITILDNLKVNGYNTVFLQVRSEGDALYSSTITPWSQWLTSTQGIAPSPLWDPLTFAVDEAHKRGLDIHAWLNPYRVQTSLVSTYPRAANHVINTNPTWILTNSTNANIKILDPGLPAVRTHIIDIVKEVANNYDVDGIHFDDYFYYGMAAVPNNQDAATYAANNPGGMTLENWRRDNVNKMVAGVYDAIQVINTARNKNIIFGISPFGIWKAGTPSGISGQSSFNDLFCDPIAWMQAGKVDYIAPQLYWRITGAQDYIALSKWWNDQTKLYNKQLYVSQGIYKLRPPAPTQDWPITEIQNQIIQNRAATMDATFGQIFYQYADVKNNTKTINATLNTAQFQYKSFAPPIAEKDAICPEKPATIRIEGLKVKWDTPAASVDDGDLPVKYVVYGFANAAEAITNKNDGSKILDIVVGTEITLDANTLSTKHIVVTSLDKNNNEGGDFNITTLGSSEFDLSIPKSVIVYPNPFQDSFSIESNVVGQNQSLIELFDSNGKQVYQQDINTLVSGKVTVSPTNLNSGIYFAKISDATGKSESFKLIKK